ncbi:UNVERIFIED_CONTAM: Retrovirus-related Pol polyprotein from transposon TNT 1-94 [Sesamum radiatum]|uniref:Retrovirus-related Pol polyprotein from transposon TNT 1-94 n=1 Tax=Sesamum radiatum TaxID=300843 RepID=A0AAW2PZ89_SESRA
MRLWNVRCDNAHLVAKGFNQIEGVDYTESFSPVAKMVMVHLFLSMTASYGWPLHQLNVNNTFLHGYSDEDLSVLPLEGYPIEPGLVCKLEHSLYGLKQASRQWKVEFTHELTEIGFHQSAHDHYLFMKPAATGLMSLLVYVDDILITDPSMDDIQAVKQYLHALFTIKDIEDARYFLGLEIARNFDDLYVAQTKYVEDIIKDTGLIHAKTVSTPFP